MEGGSRRQILESTMLSSSADVAARNFDHHHNLASLDANNCHNLCLDFGQHHHACEISDPGQANNVFIADMPPPPPHQSPWDNIDSARDSTLQTVVEPYLSSHMEVHRNNLHVMSFDPQEKSSSRGLGDDSFTWSSSSSGPNVLATKNNNKKRIKWTPDLHEKFVDCVNSLGGAKKATPKTILKMMESKGLTIFHVKSHLQKYRAESACQDAKKLCAGASEERTAIGDTPQLFIRNMQIMETLQLQLSMERHLHEQLEIQRRLQQQIEENGNQLKLMLRQQQKTDKQSKA